MPHFRRARYRDIPAIQQFIHSHYQANHILSKSKAMFVFEYFSGTNTLDQKQPINMFVLEEAAEIVAILGFYPDKTEYFLSLWSAKQGSVYGLLLLKEVEKTLTDKPLRIIGLSKQAEQLYSRLGYQVETLAYQYSEKRPLKAPISGTILTAEEFESKQLPGIMDEQRYQKRFFQNPFTTYYFYYTPSGLVYVYKKYQTEANDFLLICDIIGDLSLFSETDLQEIMEIEQFPYATVYTNQALVGLKSVQENKQLFPIYTAPYLGENATLKYAYQGDKPVIFQLRSDQGRPNRLTQRYALVNNFMYHYIRSEETVQTVNNYLPKTIFEKQIDYLTEHYAPLDMATLEKGEFDERQEYFMVSFDDGYKEHLYSAASYLEEKGIEGQFFLPARETADLLQVNKIHQILNYYRPSAILTAIQSEEPQFEEKYASYSQVASLDKPEIIFIKRYFQKESLAKALIETLFEQIPAANYQDYYLTQAEEMQLATKHLIGNHTCKHTHLPDNSPAEIEADIVQYEKQLGHLMKRKTVAYPFGSQNEEVRACYQKAGYRFGWGTRSAYSIVPEGGALNLNRYDCNELNAYLNEGVEAHV